MQSRSPVNVLMSTSPVFHNNKIKLNNGVAKSTETVAVCSKCAVASNGPRCTPDARTVAPELLPAYLGYRWTVGSPSSASGKSAFAKISNVRGTRVERKLHSGGLWELNAGGGCRTYHFYPLPLIIRRRVKCNNIINIAFHHYNILQSIWNLFKRTKHTIEINDKIKRCPL